MLVCTAEQMREIDRTTIFDYGIPGPVLMELAGRGVVAILGRLRPLAEARVAVLCGAGNNGGDGFVVARHLLGRGARVTTFLVADETKIRGDALLNLQVLQKMQAEIRPLRDEEDLQDAESTLLHANVVVDALLGTGLHSPVQGQFRRVLERANRCPALKIAVDIPSGLHAETGQVLGVAFCADHTITFAYPKLGLVTQPGVERVGTLHVVDIGVPPRVEADRDFAAEVLEPEHVRRWLLHRPAWGHKGTFGHLLVIAGSPGKTGAAILCGEGALRAGAGLVTVASPLPAMHAMENKTRELMLAPLTPDGQPPDDSDVVFDHLGQLLRGKSALAVGPGIPRGDGMRALLVRLLAESPVPVVVDADGLNELGAAQDSFGTSPVPLLLTPHPGEMARLSGLSVTEIQENRVKVAREFATRHQVYLALKGSRTVVAGPEGTLYINPTGNPGMGSGGTGDVLTGLVGSFLAQGHPPLDSLAIGVFVHGAAGDRAAQLVGQRGLLASDLLTEVGPVLKTWEAPVSTL